MVAVYAPHEIHRTLVCGALGLFQPIATGNVEEFEESLHRAHCGVLVLDDLGEKGQAAWAKRVTQRFCTRRWVLITKFRPENTRQLVGWSNVDVVWIDEIQEELAKVCRRLLSEDPLISLADRIAQWIQVSAPIREALVSACRSVRPPSTIDRLASLASTPRKRFTCLWRQHASPGSSPKEFLDLIILARAVQLCVGEPGRISVSMKLGVHEDTLARICHSVTGKSLSRISSSHLSDLTSQLESWCWEKLSV